MAANKFPIFGFPSPRRPVPPSVEAAGIAQLGGGVVVLLGAVLASVLINLVIGAWLISTADIHPFVADGGVAGCKAIILELKDGQ